MFIKIFRFVDILVADKQLAKEIEYDMKQFANQQKKSQATVVATPDKLMSPRPAVIELINLIY